MPARSVADATRFTPTGPHAFTQSPPSSSTDESPQQRVARLREQARKAKAAQELSGVDRIIDKGRVWADRMHRVTTMGLMGATLLAGGITIYAVVDLMAFNRARRREYAEKMKAEKEKEVLEGGLNTMTGTTTTTPVKEDRPGMVDKLKTWAVSGLTPADKEYKDPVARAEESAREAARMARVEEEKIATRPEPKNELVKTDGKGGVMSSITGWWTGR